MTRELRYRPTGVLFYLVFALSLILSKSSKVFFCNLTIQDPQTGIYQAAAAILGVVAILLTSDAIGFVLSSLYIFWWNILRGRFRLGKGGFSKEYRKLAYDIKSYIIAQYRNIDIASGIVEEHKSAVKTDYLKAQHQKFEKQLEFYSAEVFLSYFWQQAPSSITEWVSRRFTVFFAGVSTILGILLGLLISGVVIMVCNLGWTASNTYVTIIFIIFIIVVGLNANYVRNEAWQMIDVWFAGVLNPRMRSIFNTIKKDTTN